MNANSFNSKICNGRKRNAPMPAIIRPGMVIQFHQNVAGFRRGERVTVTARNERGVLVERQNGDMLRFRWTWRLVSKFMNPGNSPWLPAT